jgi:hypothetical protein
MLATQYFGLYFISYYAYTVGHCLLPLHVIDLVLFRIMITNQFDDLDLFFLALFSVGAQKVKYTCMQFRQLCQDKNRHRSVLNL